MGPREGEQDPDQMSEDVGLFLEHGMIIKQVAVELKFTPFPSPTHSSCSLAGREKRQCEQNERGEA